jgi:DNA-binding transcriptional LysR family regulator
MEIRNLREALTARWDDFRYFQVLADTGSVRGAAARLGVNPSTVTRRLEHLEARVGTRLFTRTPAGLRISRAGAEVVPEVEEVAAALAAIERQLAGRDADPAGQVTLVLPEAIAESSLVSGILDAVSRHPAIELGLFTAERQDSLRGADVLVRVTAQPPESMAGRRVAQLSMAAYASEEYLAGHNPLAAPLDCRWINSAFERDYGGQFKARAFPDLPVAGICEGLALQLSAVTANLGVTLLPCVLGDPAARLRRVGGSVREQEVWLLFPPELRGVARVQLVCDILDEVFSQTADLLKGRRTDPRSAGGELPKRDETSGE